MRELAQALLGLLADCACAAGLNQNDYLALARIVAADGMSPADLRQILGISAGSTSELADRLERRRLISRMAPPGDRRRIALKPTAKGVRTADRTLSPVQKRLVHISAGLNDQELAIVGRYLHEVALVLAEMTWESAGRRS